MTTAPRLRPDLPPLPPRIAALPVDDRGYPVPWFVARVGGKPEFRAADGAKLDRALRESLCWVCGTHVGPHFTFVIGPMCAVNRNTAEPPCHQECAEFSAKACPFLSKPHMTRRENDLPPAAPEVGFMIRRNPGVTCLWRTRGFVVHEQSTGVLFELLDPMSVSWWAEGRKATRAEVAASIDSGLPILRDACGGDGGQIELLDRYVERAQAYLPAA